MSHLSIDELSASLDGSLTGPGSQPLLTHLASCVLCQEQQARYALHDSALRRLFQQHPDERALDSLTRVVVERIARFTPPASAGPATIQQDTHATPADPAQPLPPSREPSRGMRVPAAGAAEPLELAPRLDLERAPEAKTEGPKPLVESYDAFNDGAYAGPVARESPPMLGRPIAKIPDADAPATKKEYRHGGVRRDTPAEPTSEPPGRRRDRAQPAPREDGFGIKRGQQPAWSRMGLEPDPSSPGSYRETLTGATVSPPPVNGYRPGARQSSSRRTALLATLALAAGLAAVALAMRVPTGAHLSFRFGHAADSTPVTRPGTPELQNATTPPPVDVAVPQPAGTATSNEEPRLCGVIVDAKGRAVEGALLTVAATTTQARTGADGRFCLQAPAGWQLVEVLDLRVTGAPARQVKMNFAPGIAESRIVLP